MIYRSKVPLRISFSGGGTDVPPYPEEKGGAVLSTTIDKFAYGSLQPREDSQIHIHSLDLRIISKYSSVNDIAYNGEQDLAKAAIKFVQNAKGDLSKGCDLYLYTDAKPGSGLGSSSALMVAAITVLCDWQNITLTDYEVAEAAYVLERKELGIPGGIQDQYSATFGGFNFIEFNKNGVLVTPLRIKNYILNELHFHLLLCFTGKTSFHANIVKNQSASVVNKETAVMNALDIIKEMTYKMKEHLLRGETDEFGRMLHEAWVAKKNLNSAISDSFIDNLYNIGRVKGALGGKILGAGGGGYLLFYCPAEKKLEIANALQKEGGEISSFSFERDGFQTWRI